MNPNSSQSIVAEKLQQLERQRIPLPQNTPFDKTIGELVIMMSKAQASGVVEHLGAALVSVNKARIAGSQTGATRT